MWIWCSPASIRRPFIGHGLRGRGAYGAYGAYGVYGARGTPADPARSTMIRFCGDFSVYSARKFPRKKITRYARDARWVRGPWEWAEGPSGARKGPAHHQAGDYPRRHPSRNTGQDLRDTL